jgi:uncharacterized protein with GYD domain
LRGGISIDAIFGLLGMYKFDAVVAEAKKNSFLIRLALAILWGGVNPQTNYFNQLLQKKI